MEFQVESNSVENNFINLGVGGMDRNHEQIMCTLPSQTHMYNS